MRAFSFFVFLLLTTQVVAFSPENPQGCTIPRNNATIQENTIFCPGRYYLPSGLAVAENNILLDCKHVTLIGDFTSVGVLISDKHKITVRNCIFDNFTEGIRLDKSHGNTLEVNSHEVLV